MRGAIAALLVWLAALPLSAAEIVSAEYNEPTTRYPHGVLGDDEEWGNLQVVVRRAKGKKGDLFYGKLDYTYDLRLPKEMVFEDVAPRLVDLDGEEGPEIIVVESHLEHGARLAVYGLNAEGVPALRSWTRFIGTPNRWLAPVGAADFNADGLMDIAFVDRPHLVRRLILVTYKEGLIENLIGGPSGVTNHRIGDDYISGGVRDCGQGPEMIMHTQDWGKILSVVWKAERFEWGDIAAYKGRDSMAAALNCE